MIINNIAFLNISIHSSLYIFFHNFFRVCYDSMVNAATRTLPKIDVLFM